MKKCGFETLVGSHEWKKCQKKADTLVYNRESGKVEKRCAEHAREVANETSPEHIDKCAHCGCLNPVG